MTLNRGGEPNMVQNRLNPVSFVDTNPGPSTPNTRPIQFFPFMVRWYFVS